MKKSGFVIVKNGAHAVGLQDQKGNEVLPCVYDKILDYDEDGYVRFIKDGVFATVNLKGEICIPLSAGLTHLGVFYQGIARAERNHLWGLVDVFGKAVTDFDFKRINAHYKDGYVAMKCSGEKGFLSETGEFKSVKPKNEEEYEPELWAVVPFTMLSKADFFYLLNMRAGGGLYDLRLYYRDTDCEVDVDHLYRKGQVIRNDRFLQVSDRLMRPVHRLRFVIASSWLVSMTDYMDFARRMDKKAIPFKEFVIPPETFFLVMDVMRLGNTTQVVLLQIPAWAYSLSQEFGFHLLQMKAVMPDGEKLVRAAELDCMSKLTEVVHGHCLDASWIDAMRWPVGLDDGLNLNALEVKDPVCYSAEETDIITYWRMNNINSELTAETIFSQYLKKSKIQLMVGDIQQFKADVTLAPSFSLTKIQKKSDIKKVCADYAEALHALPELNKFGKLSIPCLHVHCCYDWRLLLAKTVLNTILSFLRERMCQTDVFLFCGTRQEANVYEKAANE